jgi:DNA polymerase-1
MARIAVVDGNPLLWRASVMHAGLTLRSGRPSGCVYGGLDNLFRAWKGLAGACDHLVVAWDWGRSRWRRALFPGYKASREAARATVQPSRPDRPLPLPKSEVMAQLGVVQRFLDAAGVFQLAVEGVEADDLLGLLATGFAGAGHEVTLVGSDHDLHQLVRPGVRIYDPIQKAWLAHTDIGAPGSPYEGLRSEQVVDFLALSGEAGDDIPKVPGIGPKRALDILRATPSIEGLLEMLTGATAPPKAWTKTKWWESALARQESLLLAKQLTRIPTWTDRGALNDDEWTRLQAGLRRSVQVDRMRFAALCDTWEMTRARESMDVIMALPPAPVSVLQDVSA